MDKQRLRILLQNLQKLPTLPVALTAIINIANQPSSSASDLGKVITHDPSISSRLLRLVNSAFYGHFREISSIPHAVVILGFRTVKEMAMGVSFFNMSKSSGSGSAFDHKKFWIHCVAVGVCAKHLSGVGNAKGVLDRDSAFVCGLLHDIGKIALFCCFEIEYEGVIKTAKEECRLIYDVEREVIEIDHCEAGLILTRKWQFPQFVPDVIGRHHEPMLKDDAIALPAGLIQVSDHICRKIKIGSGGDDVETAPAGEIFEMCGFDDKIMEDAIVEMEEHREDIESFVGELG
ncbi:hypothetical protein MNBD_NITROSPINAE02-1491 [hydrothermal vent metagenome]|uniref:HDOD domain-containing protein n=1 Tax=hydrothermal vent metagenome TaxID=652676 RepID=A0A3B1D089_9ZZZZ